MKVIEAQEAVCTCPRTWSARAEDGRPVHARLEHGWLSVGVGPPWAPEYSAVDLAVNRPLILMNVSGEFTVDRLLRLLDRVA